jgi:hypothetical protein
MSVDISKPATAAEFEAHGIDPAQAAQMAALHEATMGRGDALVPVLRSEPTSGATAQAESAQARLDQITSDRAAGKISDYEWRSKYEREVLTLRDQIVAGANHDLSHLEQVYQPPANAWDYRVPPANGQVTDEARAADSALTQMLHAERVPLAEGLSDRRCRTGLVLGTAEQHYVHAY